VGLTFSPENPVAGTITSTSPENCKNSTVGDPKTCVNLSVPQKVKLGITSVTIFKIKLPTQCETATPVSFPLSANLTLLEIVTVGAHFEGQTTIPNIKCGGLFGGILGSVLSALMSGPENTYSLNINPPKA
jgi:hypothetical protein